jgi:hypothetical protein
MTKSTVRKLGLLAALLATYVMAGCAQPSFESFLPSDWPDGLETVFRNAEDFAVPAAGEIVSGKPGDFLDPLGDLVGCWGGYAPEWIGTTEGFPTNLYQSLVFHTDGTFTRSAMNELPGQIALVFVQVGRYQVEAANTIRLLNGTLSTYSPSSHTYVPFGEQPAAEQVLLATRDGDLLRLEPETVANESSSVSYVPILRRFDCGR